MNSFTARENNRIFFIRFTISAQSLKETCTTSSVNDRFPRWPWWSPSRKLAPKRNSTRIVREHTFSPWHEDFGYGECKCLSTPRPRPWCYRTTHWPTRKRFFFFKERRSFKKFHRAIKSFSGSETLKNLVKLSDISIRNVWRLYLSRIFIMFAHSKISTLLSSILFNINKFFSRNRMVFILIYFKCIKSGFIFLD